MTETAKDPMLQGWDALDWRQRRERRFERWISAPGVEFESATRSGGIIESGSDLLIDAIELKKPARVPVTTSAGFYVGKYSGLTKKEAMYDYEKAAAALRKYHEDFRPDFQTASVAPARVFELLGLTARRLAWPRPGR